LKPLTLYLLTGHLLFLATLCWSRSHHCSFILNPILVSTRHLETRKAREILIMSNRFVSAGTIGSSGELSKDTGATAAPTEQPLYDSAKNKEWETVQKELDAERRRREEQRVKAATGDGEQSLYDILQANKGKPTPP
jgi:hypothetical protein